VVSEKTNLAQRREDGSREKRKTPQSVKARVIRSWEALLEEGVKKKEKKKGKKTWGEGRETFSALETRR